MRYSYPEAVTILLCVFAAGCGPFNLFSDMDDDPNETAARLAPGETALVTDAAEYGVHVEGDARVVDFELTYHNPLKASVAVPACHSPARPMLQKLVEGEWVHAFSPAEPACITSPLVIPGRDTHQFSYQLRVYAHDLERWPASVDNTLEGTYRLHWWVGMHDRSLDTGVGTPLPTEYVISNAFRLLP